MLLRRRSAHLGYDATLVINVTDINDKIYDAAREAGELSAQLAAEMTRLYVEDTDLLGLGRPDAEPLATETVPEIIALIEALIERGHAYESGGDVYSAAELRGLREALEPGPGRDGPGGGGRHAEPQGGRARLRALEGDQGG